VGGWVGGGPGARARATLSRLASPLTRPVAAVVVVVRVQAVGDGGAHGLVVDGAGGLTRRGTGGMGAGMGRRRPRRQPRPRRRAGAADPGRRPSRGRAVVARCRGGARARPRPPGPGARRRARAPNGSSPPPLTLPPGTAPRKSSRRPFSFAYHRPAPPASRTSGHAARSASRPAAGAAARVTRGATRRKATRNMRGGEGEEDGGVGSVGRGIGRGVPTPNAGRPRRGRSRLARRGARERAKSRVGRGRGGRADRRVSASTAGLPAGPGPGAGARSGRETMKQRAPTRARPSTPQRDARDDARVLRRRRRGLPRPLRRRQPHPRNRETWWR